MVDKQKVINFIQDFGCAKLEQLQILFRIDKTSLKSILSSNMVSKKDNVFVHNRKSIDNNMLVAIDILCKYQTNKRLEQFYQGYKPVYITFLSTEHLLYHIIVADEDNKKGIIKRVNSYPLLLPKADKLILAFPDMEELANIDCEIPFLYCTYPNLEIMN